MSKYVAVIQIVPYEEVENVAAGREIHQLTDVDELKGMILTRGDVLLDFFEPRVIFTLDIHKK
ncbi:MAG: hypothetical protein PHW24_01795 [Candidatus Moranbacteria bacterium]|nr:hypothetical protein [Candidatus Moranbacteria bacterium]